MLLEIHKNVLSNSNWIKLQYLSFTHTIQNAEWQNMYVWWYSHWFTRLTNSISENDIDGGHHISTTVKTFSIQWWRQCILYFVGTVCFECKALHVWKIHPVRHYPCLVLIVTVSTFLWDCFLINSYSKDCQLSSSNGASFHHSCWNQKNINRFQWVYLVKIFNRLSAFLLPLKWTSPSTHSDKYTLACAAICGVRCIRIMTASVESIYMWIYDQEW